MYRIAAPVITGWLSESLCHLPLADRPRGTAHDRYTRAMDTILCRKGQRACRWACSVHAAYAASCIPHFPSPPHPPPALPPAPQSSRLSRLPVQNFAIRQTRLRKSAAPSFLCSTHTGILTRYHTHHNGSVSYSRPGTNGKCGRLIHRAPLLTAQPFWRSSAPPFWRLIVSLSMPSFIHHHPHHSTILLYLAALPSPLCSCSSP